MLRRLLTTSFLATARMASSGAGGAPTNTVWSGGKLGASSLNKLPKDVTEDEWKKILTPEEFHIARQAGTEKPGTGAFDKHMKPGEFTCVCCGTKLFVSETKFDSGCGWPAFYASEKAGDAKEVVERITDASLGMVRVEVRCKVCNAHLGHVFEDGPMQHGGERFCINSACLAFTAKK